MSETQIVFTAQGLLLAWAMWRRPQRIMLALALFWLAGLAVAEYWPRETRLPIVIGLEALLVVAMGWLARRYRSDRALVVMSIGVLVIVWAIAAALLDWAQHFRAAGINAAFIAQVLVGGGFADGFLAWLGHRAHLARAGIDRVLGGLA